MPVPKNLKIKLTPVVCFTINATAFFLNAGDALGLVGHVYEAKRRHNSGRSRDRDKGRELDSHAIRCGSDRRREVRPVPYIRIAATPTDSTRLTSVDFVLESGNGEPDDETQPLIDSEFRVANGELSQSDNRPSPGSQGHLSQSLSAQPARSEEESRRHTHRTNRDGKQHHPPFHPTGVRRELRPGRRSWPLRDPEEAYLLKHFVDRIASFVSPSLLVNEEALRILTGFSLTAQIDNNISRYISLTGHDIATRYSTPSWPSLPVT
ncbi:hypothetical protein N7481_001237 [Penicillium waksmanii]|uniref:uncharacterized protein n=1 Tax=Penicillium waksmanii TaxID=69791 RepID=UPI002547C538|nr:uncharacterized protein N7481_001237 [Penicillium waksmanii]KAJ6000828.1 hypothetical protein N7481_001237 [Penicillium waksmanii]